MYIEDIRYHNRRSLGIKEIEVFLGSYIYYQQVREEEGDKITRNYKFIGGSKRVIQEYRRKVYSQVNILKKGRRKNSKEREIFQRSSIKFQRFFRLNDQNITFKVRRDIIREEEEEGGVSKGKGKEYSRSLEKLILEKKNKNQEILKNRRVNSKIRRVDIDNQLKMLRQKDILKGIKIEKVRLQLESIKEEGLVVYKAFIRRLVRNIIVVIRSLDIE